MALRPRHGIRAPWSHALLSKTENEKKGKAEHLITYVPSIMFEDQRMVCVGFVSRSEEPRQGRALAHGALHAHGALPDDQVL